jgi:large subunit ribosomal protein L15
MGLRIGNIQRPHGFKKKGKRVGRGIGSGKGKTSGKGHKGALARSGGGDYNPGFEGGQMPLVRRIPKRGFTNIFKKEWSILNIGTLQNSEAVGEGAVVDRDFLLKSGLVRNKRLPVKVLGKGTISKAITVKAAAFSRSAAKAIQEAGGKTEIA